MIYEKSGLNIFVTIIRRMVFLRMDILAMLTIFLPVFFNSFRNEFISAMPCWSTSFGKKTAKSEIKKGNTEIIKKAHFCGGWPSSLKYAPSYMPAAVPRIYDTFPNELNTSLP